MCSAIVELTRPAIDELLGEQLVGRIGCHAHGVTHVVPVIYAYDGRCIYVVSVEGLKIRMMRENPRVCFEVDRYDPNGGWRSAIVQARYEELQGDEAEWALHLVAERFAAREASRRKPRTVGSQPVAFRLRLLEATGRAAGCQQRFEHQGPESPSEPSLRALDEA